MKRIVTIEYKPNQGPPGQQGPPGPGTTLPLDSGDVVYAADGRTVEEILEELLFVDLVINSFTTPQTVFENGQVITSLTFTWGLNKAITSQTITGTQVTPPTLLAADRSKTVNFTSLSSNGTVTLTCNDGSGAPVVTSTINLTFLKGVYLGVAPIGTIDSAFILNLNKTLQSNYVRSANLNLGAGQYAWFAAPVAYGTPNFKINGFSGGFEPPSVVSFTNSFGATENYNVWRSTNANIGLSFIEIF